jgi:hypothetical protein
MEVENDSIAVFNIRFNKSIRRLASKAILHPFHQSMRPSLQYEPVLQNTDIQSAPSGSINKSEGWHQFEAICPHFMNEGTGLCNLCQFVTKYRYAICFLFLIIFRLQGVVFFISKTFEKLD